MKKYRCPHCHKDVKLKKRKWGIMTLRKWEETNEEWLAKKNL